MHYSREWWEWRCAIADGGSGGMLREVVGVEVALREVVGMDVCKGRWWELRCAKRGGGSVCVLREVVGVEVC